MASFAEVKFGTRNNLTVVWLLALMLNAFSIAVLADEKEIPSGMVYCPLTKQLQPIKAKEPRENPLFDFCANDERKDEFAAGYLTSGQAQTGELDRDDFEKLVFDFFKKGSEVFLGLPFKPELPNRKSVENLNASVPAGRTDGFRTNPATRTAEFSFDQNPRPPDSISRIYFSSVSLHSLKDVSRNINPRSPPALS